MTLQRFPFAHTFSIAARNPHTGQMGVAVQSHWFSVGSIVTWAEAGVGAIATQAMVEPGYGPSGLELLRGGMPASQALLSLLDADSGKDLRQVAMVDSRGDAAAHTGASCIQAAGHIQGEGFSAQANMMDTAGVWPAMAAAYQSAEGDLADRLLAALWAGQSAGGDIRGQQSAAILVVAAQSSGKPWVDRLFDLRVEDHPQPIRELRRLVKLKRAYDFMNLGDELLGKGQVEAALEAYRKAVGMAPKQIEMPFWQAVTLAGLGRVDEAVPIFRRVFRINPAWRELLRRLPAAGLLEASPETLALLLRIEA